MIASRTRRHDPSVNAFETQLHAYVLESVPAAIALLRGPGLPPVPADPLRLERVLLNLVSNALEYSEGEVLLRARAEGRRLLVEVADAGEGIAPEDLDRIFDRFFRAPGARHVEGLGLGLYVARALAEVHGGALTAASPGAGRGATFTLVLPLA